jgi:hypothetical protein
MNEAQQYFKDNNYVVIRNFINPEIASLLYYYCKIKVRATDFKYYYDKKAYNKDWDGMWSDPQAMNSYSTYGDFMMDSLLELSNESMESYTGIKLLPNYTYWRLYKKDDVLEKHLDRPSCEISMTMCLGYDASNVDKEMYPNYNWAMWVEDKDSKEIPIQLNPGDAIIYRGTIVKHWRDKFLGLNQAQVFMHYNDANGDYQILNDGRPFVGIPKKFQV